LHAITVTVKGREPAVVSTGTRVGDLLPSVDEDGFPVLGAIVNNMVLSLFIPLVTDATIEPMFTTKGGQVLEGEYRQRWNEGGMWLQGSVGENPNGGLGGEKFQIYAHLFGSGRFEITPGRC